MGLTIHYQLHSETRSIKKARELIARLRSRALDLPFERVNDLIELNGSQCDHQQYGQEHPHRSQLSLAGGDRQRHAGVRGVRQAGQRAAETGHVERDTERAPGLCYRPVYRVPQASGRRGSQRRFVLYEGAPFLG